MAKKKVKTKKTRAPQQKGIKGNGYSKRLGRTYPGIIGLPTPDLPGTSRGVDM